MKIFTDNIYFAKNYLQNEPYWRSCNISEFDENIRLLLLELFGVKKVFWGEVKSTSMWQYFLLIDYAPNSQYDILINLSRESSNLPDGILCVAGSGNKFHGFKNRRWESLPGNIHLSAFLSPNQIIENFGAGFMVLAAVSVVKTLDALPGLVHKSSIKWVNDIIIEDNKVCGVLAHTQNQGSKVKNAILGIGINVKSSPEIEPTRFVPKAASLCKFVQKNHQCNLEMVFSRLSYFLEINYKKLISDKYIELFQTYKKRSSILQQNVSIWTDEQENEELIAKGKVSSIGENLELFIEGLKEPITKGRLAIEE